MKKATRKVFWSILPILLLTVISCASVPKPRPLPLEEFDLRADLGKIGIVSATFQPVVRFQLPMTKWKAAAIGAARGAQTVLMTGQGCYKEGCAAILALVPVGAAAGSIVGAVTGVSSKEIKETDEILNDYLASVNFQETMRERFLAIAKEQTPYSFLSLQIHGPNVMDEEVTYGSLPDKRVDTILEIGLRKCELWGKRDSINPPLHFLMAVGMRLIRAIDGRVLFSRNFVYDYQNISLKFSEWSVNNAQPFRDELDRGFEYLAVEIVRVLSIIQTPLTSSSRAVD